jgi:hypothetical protein
MAIKTPIKATFTGSDVTGLAEFQSGDSIGVAYGGTGANTLTGVVIGNGVSALTTVTDGTTGQVLTTNGAGTYSFQDAASNVASLTDVTLTSLADGEILKYDSGTGQWVNAADAGFSYTMLSASDGITYNNSTGAFSLTDTGVTANTYGSSSQVPVITVNANGQITSATTAAVAGVSSTSFNTSTGVLTINTSDGSSYTEDLGIGTADSPQFTGLTVTNTITGTVSSLSNHDTDDLAQGSTNLYYSDSLVDSHLSGGTGVTYSSGTISIGQDVGTTSNVEFNNLTVQGDLTVNGTTTTINATELAIEDNMIYLNDGSTTTNPDLGWAGNYNDGTYAHAGIFRDATDGVFKFYDGYTPEPGQAIDIAHASFNLADVQAGAFTGNLTGNVTGTVSSLSNHDTDDLAQGSTNLYYANSLVDTHLNTSTATANDMLVWNGSDYAWSAPAAQNALVSSNTTYTVTLEDTGDFTLQNSGAIANKEAVLTTTTANQTVDTFPFATYRTAKYIFQATAGSDVHATELLITHDGTTVYTTEYATIFSGSSLMTLGASISGSNVVVTATPANADTTIDFVRVSLIRRQLSGLEGDLSTQSGTEDLSSGSGTEDLNA